MHPLSHVPLAQVDVAGNGDLALLRPDLDGVAQHAWSPVHLNLVGQELLEGSCTQNGTQGAGGGFVGARCMPPCGCKSA